jgi:hypothetical protein
MRRYLFVDRCEPSRMLGEVRKLTEGATINDFKEKSQ